MKKVIYTIIIYSFLQLLFFMCLLIFDSDKKQKFNKAPEGFAIMLFDETKNDYTEVEGIPIGFYELNSDKSYCTNGGNITSYDRKTGKLNYSINGSDKCVIYIDVLPDKEEPALAVTSEYFKTITIDFTDDIALSGYAVTSNNVSPGSWTEISGTSSTVTYEASELGEYYIWVKDWAGNISSIPATIGQKLILAGYYFYDDYNSAEKTLEEILLLFDNIFGYSMQENISFSTFQNYEYDNIIFNSNDSIYLAKNSYVGNIVQYNGILSKNIYFCTSSTCNNSNSSFASSASAGSPWGQLTGDITHFYLYYYLPCFSENTYVYIYDEKRKRKLRRKIKRIKVGDIVYTYDEIIGKVVRKKVKNVFFGKNNKMCDIYINNEVLTVTQCHMVYTKDKGYIKAKALTKEDLLINNLVKIDNIIVYKLDKPQNVVTIELEDGHGLIVGKKQVVMLSLISIVVLFPINVDAETTSPTPPAPPAPPSLCS